MNWNRHDLSETPTEFEAPSVLDLKVRLRKRWKDLPANERPTDLRLMLKALNTRSATIRLRVFTALGHRHWLGKTDGKRHVRAQMRYRMLPSEFIDHAAEPSEEATIVPVKRHRSRRRQRRTVTELIVAFMERFGIVSAIVLLTALALTFVFT